MFDIRHSKSSTFGPLTFEVFLKVRHSVVQHSVVRHSIIVPHFFLQVCTYLQGSNTKSIHTYMLAKLSLLPHRITGAIPLSCLPMYFLNYRPGYVCADLRRMAMQDLLLIPNSFKRMSSNLR
jgi:hypothetical protein